jgi:hypothetical protein
VSDQRGLRACRRKKKKFRCPVFWLRYPMHKTACRHPTERPVKWARNHCQDSKKPPFTRVTAPTHLWVVGIRTIQQLLGHSHLETTMIYTHVIRRGPLGVASPLDAIPAPTPQVIAPAHRATETALPAPAEAESVSPPEELDEARGTASAPTTPTPSVRRALKPCWQAVRASAALLLALFLPWKVRM